ncbi:copper resistance protein CopC [Georgenia sp. TF02-10]|uniref:copper resistance CopC family protein n=1 Tax=Georgenia sp. TF02-10 TaxID=2917725 RepID=UPI001FA76294|nr:copper resistance CopC family protein [Georgenia sp. TF02-10]UNX54745.1 copper resistance protein CopC [Georgenia sp. TF02-10]
MPTSSSVGSRAPAPRSAAWSALLAALLGGLLLLAAAAPARAHDVLLESSPADGETLPAAPAEIVLTFNNELLDGGQAIVVADASGATVAEGSPVLAGRTATLALPDLPGGQYAVTWSVVSSDGHRIDGELGFTVEGTAATGTPDTAGTTAPGAATAGPTDPGTAAPADTADGGAEAAGDAAAGGVPGWVWLVLAVGALGGVVALAVRQWRG